MAVSRGSVATLIGEADLLFHLLDVNKTGEVNKQLFIDGLLSLPYIDVAAAEAGRMFDSLTNPHEEEKSTVVSNMKKNEERLLVLSMLKAGVLRWTWLRSMLKIFSAFQHSKFRIPEDYDFTKSTVDNYRVDHMEFTGPYADIRSTRDYSWHHNVSLERQSWQDLAIKTCLGKTEAQPRPWVVYTCGPMGVGKGHVLNWLSAQQLFPLEYIVHVDPDFFKSIMPEWTSYRDINEEQAGSLCHAESIYLQEIAMETALRQRQHVLVDGSLSNGEWFSSVFDDIRSRFPHYRIAIVYISASESTVRRRIAERSKKTGRSVPESQIVRSLESPEKSISLLAPKTNLVVRIVNEEKIELKSVEDHSGNWHRGLRKHFGSIAHQRPPFPSWHGPIFMELTSILGDCIVDNSFKAADSHLRPTSVDLQKSRGHSGILLMESTSRLQLKSRHVVLANGRLTYFKVIGESLDSYSLRGEVPINALSSVFLEWPTGQSNNLPFLRRSESGGYANKPCQFGICGMKDNGIPYSFHLLAETSEQRDEWLNAIKLEINDSKSRVLCTGILDKQGHIVANWRSRYFVLSPGKLSYYNSEDDPHLRGEIIISATSTVSGTNSAQSTLRSNGILSGFLLDASVSPYFIIITGNKKDKSRITLNCSAKTKNEQLIWIKNIQREINYRKKLVNLERGYYANSFEDLRLTSDVTRNSPNLQSLHNVLPEMSLRASKVVRSNLDKAEEENAVYLRWLFHGQDIDFSLPETRDINRADPDVCLLRLGGLVEYDKSGAARAVRAIVEHQTMHMIEFGEPEKLQAQDVARLHAGERWIPVKSLAEAAAGARYMTFILPYEDLVSRRFPRFGCFAYIFREPDEMEDDRDRYFPLLGDF